MEKYSYSQNSRIARRIKERERKRKRRRRIIKSVIALIILSVCGVCTVKYLPDLDLPDFNPKEGFVRLCIKLGIAEPAGVDEPVSGEAPVVAGNVSEADTTDEAVSDDTVEEGEEIPVIDDEGDEPMETDFWDAETDASVNGSAGIYPPASENNNLLDIFKNAKGETEKICCLTFDDGPNKATTPEILEILKKHNIKATFFELGEKLAVNKELAKRTYDEGHLLANHTYTQKYSTIYTDKNAFLDEVGRTEALITEITGQPAYKLIRLPGGGFNSGVYGGVKQEYKRLLAENGYYFIDWNADNGDDGSRNASDILTYVKDYCGSKPVVLLMEDQPSRKATVAALDSVIEYLKSCDYTFKRLDEIAYYTAEEAPAGAVSGTDNSGIAQKLFGMRGRIL